MNDTAGKEPEGDSTSPEYDFGLRVLFPLFALTIKNAETATKAGAVGLLEPPATKPASYRTWF